MKVPSGAARLRIVKQQGLRELEAAGWEVEVRHHGHVWVVARCPDALFGVQDGVQFGDFDREAPSLAGAVVSAIDDVEAAGGRVVFIEHDDLVTLGEIAERVGRTDEAVRLYATGRRGPGAFPQPIARKDGPSRLYSWHDVSQWFARTELAELAPDPANAITAALNAKLRLKQLLNQLDPPDRDLVAEL